MLRKVLSIFLLFMFVFSASVFAQSDWAKANRTPQEEKAIVSQIFSESFAFLRTFDFWFGTTDDMPKVVKVVNEILKKKYKMDNDDFLVRVGHKVLNQPNCQKVILIDMYIQGKYNLYNSGWQPIYCVKSTST